MEDFHVQEADDIPEKQNDDQNNGGYQQKNSGNYQRQQYNRPAQAQPQAQPSTDMAALMARINSTTDVASLVSLYLDNTSVIESNPELKTLLSTRKKALQSL